MFLNICKQTFHISHVRISQKVGALMWNLQHIIFIWRQRYWQIFKSALVYLKDFPPSFDWLTGLRKDLWYKNHIKCNIYMCVCVCLPRIDDVNFVTLNTYYSNWVNFQKLVRAKKLISIKFPFQRYIIL